MSAQSGQGQAGRCRVECVSVSAVSSSMRIAKGKGKKAKQETRLNAPQREKKEQKIMMQNFFPEFCLLSWYNRGSWKSRPDRKACFSMGFLCWSRILTYRMRRNANQEGEREREKEKKWI